MAAETMGPTTGTMAIAARLTALTASDTSLWTRLLVTRVRAPKADWLVDRRSLESSFRDPDRSREGLGEPSPSPSPPQKRFRVAWPTHRERARCELRTRWQGCPEASAFQPPAVVRST